MFTVILAVFALADYVLIAFCIVNFVDKPLADKPLADKPAVKPAELPKGISEGAVTEPVNNDKDFNAYLEEQNYRIALLSFNVNEILSNIDSIVEKGKAERGHRMAPAA